MVLVSVPPPPSKAQYFAVHCSILKHSAFPVTISFHSKTFELPIDVFAIPPSNESSAVYF